MLYAGAQKGTCRTSSKPCSTGRALEKNEGNTAPSVCRKWSPLLTMSLLRLSAAESRWRLYTSLNPETASSLLKTSCGRAKRQAH